MKRFRWPTGGVKPTSVAIAPAPAAAPLAPVAGPQALTLQDLVLLRVTLSWQEAVAVVLECLNARPDQATFPDPAQVTLSEIGEVRTIGAAAAPGQPVQAAASVLQQLLGQASTPPELRAVIEQNLATPPRHAALDDFGKALAYFERPGRRGDVAAVFGRGHALYLKAHADLELERLRARAVREQNAPAAVAAPIIATWQQRALDAALVVVLIAVIGIGGVALFTMAFAPAATRGAAAVSPVPTVSSVASAGEEARRLVSEGVARVSEAVGRDAPVATEAPTATAGTLPAGNDSRRSSPSGGPRLAAPVANSGGQGDGAAVAAGTNDGRVADGNPGARAVGPRNGEGVPIGGEQPVVEWSVSVRDVTAAMASQPVLEPLPREDERDVPVFSLNNGDVTPAHLVRPQLPSRMTDGSGDPQASTLDLTIDEYGRVERVRLESTRNNINEKMLVAAAKAWVFQPATRGGRPVRYRLRVQLAE